MYFKPFQMILTWILTSLTLLRMSSAGTLVEDFSSLTQSDPATSTGLWNVIDRVVQAGVVADGNANRPITFGDGSDGDLVTSSDTTFDTDTHPNGFNFKSVSITGGTIMVRGSYPLVIRSLSTMTITPAVSVSGENGSGGASSGVAIASGPSGGIAKASRAVGGKGGDAFITADATLLNGGNAILASGSMEVATGGNGSIGAAAAASASIAISTGPDQDFDVSTNFVAGSGGGGGGGHFKAGDILYATGGSGGAGGGTLRLISVGTLSVGATSAQGGNGGNGAASTTASSGNGHAGNGGAIWLQSFKSLAAPSTPDYSGGVDLLGNGLDGYRRADCPTASQPAWAIAAGEFYNTSNAAANRSYVIYSRAYDLGMFNASFSTPSVDQVLNGGAISIKYAGSADGVTYSDFRDEINVLNDQNYRYLKFQITITTASVAGPSPRVSRISIPYSDLGPEKVEVSFSAGCGSLLLPGVGGGRGESAGMLAALFWFVAFAGFWLRLRHRQRTTLSSDAR